MAALWVEVWHPELQKEQAMFEGVSACRFIMPMNSKKYLYIFLCGSGLQPACNVASVAKHVTIGSVN